MSEKNCVLVAIGDELLSGVRSDANCSWLAWHLNNAGWTLESVEIVPDTESRIHDVMDRWLGKVALMVICGGLGPTHDDRTRVAIANYLGCPLRPDPLYDKVLARYANQPERLAHLEQNRDTQAMVPEASRAVYNPEGSALGIDFIRNGTRVLSLPGVPLEYRAMVHQELPVLFSGADCWTSVIILGLPETEVVSKIPDIIQDESLHVSVLPAFQTVELIIRSETGDSKHVARAEDIIRSRFDNVLPSRTPGLHTQSGTLPALTLSLADAVVNQCRAAGKTLTCAESCTGGLVQGALTAIPGSSECFKGGVVTYSDAAKKKIIGVPPSIIDTFGVVTPECAEAMASGALMVMNADFAVSVTGIAGPDGGTDDTPVGSVWFGFSSRTSTGRAKTVTLHRMIHGDRNEIRERAVNFALAGLWRTIKSSK